VSATAVGLNELKLTDALTFSIADRLRLLSEAHRSGSFQPTAGAG